MRPAWLEIDLAQLARNFDSIAAAAPASVGILSVVKDDAYGHGALAVARVAARAGARGFAVVTVGEGIALRAAGFKQPILVLGQRADDEFAACVEHGLSCSINSPGSIAALVRAAQSSQRVATVHLKVNTGMNRYGVRWDDAAVVAAAIAAEPNLRLEGVFSHFAMSDELDKTFARLQIDRFRQTLQGLQERRVSPGWRHLCNTGGFLDLPEAHYDMARIGILAYGVYPSQVCKRIPGIAPVMSVKTRIAGFQNLEDGDKVGYGLRYTAPGRRRIAVIPLGYGDGFPRVRNAGHVLIRGKRAPLVGGVAMDAFTVDVTDIPEAEMWDEVVVMGRQGAEEITVHDLAALKNSVSYDVLTGWRARLPRIYLEPRPSRAASATELESAHAAHEA